mgnify:CR=1 FL=1
MGNRYLSVYVESQKTHKQVKDGAAYIFRSMGGLVFETPSGFQISNGKFGISMGFTANLTANVQIQKIKEDRYEIQMFLNWNWATFMWVMLILGFLTGGFTVLLMFLYLFFDPAPAYNQMLYRIVNYERE